MTTPTAAQLLSAALRYAATGWPVFLLGRTKRPARNCPACPRDGAPDAHDPQACDCLTCHGFYAATRDPKRIRRMFAALPFGLLAIRTGAPSELVVIDIDPAAGGRESLAQLVAQGCCSPTRWVRSGGAGFHLYYRHPGPHVKIPSLNSEIAPGIDIKADGGYVVAPPSRHPRTHIPYAWADPTRSIEETSPALRAAIDTAVAARTASRTVPTAATLTTPRSGGDVSHPDKLAAALRDRLAAAPDGRRRLVLYGCARGYARLIHAGHLTAGQAYDELVTTCDHAGWPRTRVTHNSIREGFAAEGVHI